MLFFHGNSGNMSHREHIVDLCNKFNINLIMVDYRGYGESGGYPSQENILEDAVLVYKYFKKRIDTNKLLIWGNSMGGAPATYVASKYNCSKLILTATFSSLEDLVAKTPMIPNDSLAWSLSTLIDSTISEKLPSQKWIKYVSSPVIVVHSLDDELIPHKCARILYDNANEPKELITVSGSHNNMNISEHIYDRMLQI